MPLFYGILLENGKDFDRLQDSFTEIAHAKCPQ
jgi:hypothetical protein